MKKITSIFLYFFIVSANIHLLGQKTYELYLDDSLELYFDSIFYKIGYNYSHENMRDSLPDGNYILYNKERNSKNSKYKCIILKGQYINNKKNGRFITPRTRVFDRKEKRCKLIYQEVCDYKDGKKHGKELGYNIIHVVPSPLLN